MPRHPPAMPSHRSAPCLASATERLYPVAVCLTRPLFMMPMAGASSSPLGNAMRSSAPPWGTVGYLLSALAGHHDDEAVICLTRHAVNNPHPAMQPTYVGVWEKDVVAKKAAFSSTIIGPRSRRRPLSATQHNPTTSLVDISFHCHET
jgi:hypothetical protein